MPPAAAPAQTTEPPPRRRGPLVWLGVAVSVVLVAGFVAYAVFLASQASSDIDDASGGEDVGRAQPFTGPGGAQATAYGAGARAPDFAFTARTGVAPLQGRDGQSVKLSDFVGRPVWISIFASWCAPCRTEMPDLNAVYRDVQARDAQAGPPTDWRCCW